jgi:nitronate monooxygenase
MLSPQAIREQVERFRARTDKPVNLNFFTHTPATPNNALEARWRDRLAPYYRELGVDPGSSAPQANRAPFDDAALGLVLELRPKVVSFQYGLPEERLLAPLRAAGILVFGCATTVAEARWLEARGVAAIVAQGFEAGGHRGIFLSADVATQVGTFALLPQIVDAVDVPVVAAGGIGDARGIVAAFALGAAAVQIGTAYLHCPEAKVSAPHRTALSQAADTATALTNVMSGRPARGIVNRLMRDLGPLSDEVPGFPLAAGALAPLRAKAEAAGSGRHRVQTRADTFEVEATLRVGHGPQLAVLFPRRTGKGERGRGFDLGIEHRPAPFVLDDASDHAPPLETHRQRQPGIHLFVQLGCQAGGFDSHRDQALLVHLDSEPTGRVGARRAR